MSCLNRRSTPDKRIRRSSSTGSGGGRTGTGTVAGHIDHRGSRGWSAGAGNSDRSSSNTRGSISNRYIKSSCGQSSGSCGSLSRSGAPVKRIRRSPSRRNHCCCTIACSAGGGNKRGGNGWPSGIADACSGCIGATVIIGNSHGVISGSQSCSGLPCL